MRDAGKSRMREIWTFGDAGGSAGALRAPRVPHPAFACYPHSAFQYAPVPHSNSVSRAKRTVLKLGTQGWNYDAWRGPFFPSATRPADYLTLYSRAFGTVEVDSTFYAIPSAKVVRGWASRVGADFVFAVKLPQEVTHEHHLRNCDDVCARFFDVARELGPKLGPVLIQLGPEFAPAELPALVSFLPTLPRDIKFAIEFRHRGWISDGFTALLAEHGVALALVDGRWIPRKTMLALAERPTADFAYIRWMGPNRDIVDYSRIQVDRTRELELWAQIIPALQKKAKVIYGYANNHFAGHSPETVRMLQRMLKLPTVDPSRLGDQLTLF